MDSLLLRDRAVLKQSNLKLPSINLKKILKNPSSKLHHLPIVFLKNQWLQYFKGKK